MNKNTQSYPLFTKAAFSFKEAIDSTLLADDEPASIGKLPAGMDISRNPGLSKAVDLAKWLKATKLDPETQKPILAAENIALRKDFAGDYDEGEPSLAVKVLTEFLALNDHVAKFTEVEDSGNEEDLFKLARMVGDATEKLREFFKLAEPYKLLAELEADPMFLKLTPTARLRFRGSILDPRRDEKLSLLGDFFAIITGGDRGEKLKTWLDTAEELAEEDPEVAAMLNAVLEAVAAEMPKVAPVEVTPVTEVKLEVKVAETEETPANAVPSTSLGQALLNAKNAPRTNQQRSNKPRNK